MNKKVFCIIGKTCSGKSSITNEVAKDLDLNILKSYTTRSMRKNETVENSDHIFINPKDVDIYKDDMVAYTDRVGYCSFATKTQLLNNDFYIINPSGFLDLLDATKDIDNLELVDIWINCSDEELLNRAMKRGDYTSWEQNFIAERHEFESYPYPKTYVVNNDKSLNKSVNDMKTIVKKELGL